MLALDAARGKEFTDMAAALGRPVAVLVVSAHYERSPVTIGTTETRPLIYDFRGFSRALYEVEYAAPGAPKLARRVEQVLSPLGPVASDPRRGLDHGAWVPLKWMYPEADVPVLPVSLPSHDARTLHRIGQALRPLREEGVLILASGNATHNLRRIDGRRGAPTPAWAAEFDAWLAEITTRREVDALLDWEKKAPAARTNHPTVEHFVPLILAEGARRDDDQVAFPITGWDAGSLSRRCVTYAAPVRRAG
jgi:4,5-DOPA dioxygenase extradiol